MTSAPRRCAHEGFAGERLHGDSSTRFASARERLPNSSHRHILPTYISHNHLLRKACNARCNAEHYNPIIYLLICDAERPLTVPEAFLGTRVSVLIATRPARSALTLLPGRRESTSALLRVIIEKDRNVQYDSYIIQLISCPGEKRRRGVHMSTSSPINRRNNFQLHEVHAALLTNRTCAFGGEKQRYGRRERRMRQEAIGCRKRLPRESWFRRAETRLWQSGVS